MSGAPVWDLSAIKREVRSRLSNKSESRSFTKTPAKNEFATPKNPVIKAMPTTKKSMFDYCDECEQTNGEVCSIHGSTRVVTDNPVENADSYTYIHHVPLNLSQHVESKEIWDKLRKSAEAKYRGTMDTPVDEPVDMSHLAERESYSGDEGGELMEVVSNDGEDDTLTLLQQDHTVAVDFVKNEALDLIRIDQPQNLIKSEESKRLHPRKPAKTRPVKHETGETSPVDSDDDNQQDEDFIPSSETKTKNRRKNVKPEKNMASSVDATEGIQDGVITDLPRHECPTCDEFFLTEASLRIHCKTHDTDKPYVCKLCGKAFTSKESWRGHRKVHQDQQNYQCHICSKLFKASNRLRQHLRVHSDDRPHGCVVCGKGFKTVGDLVKHSRIHTGEKPYACHKCDKAFTRSGDLRHHLRVHDGDKPHACSICDRRFYKCKERNIHERSHTGERPYECKVCGKRYTSSSSLIIHRKTHSDDRKTHSGERKTHSGERKTHSGDRPFLCHMCDKSFGTLGHLKRHMLVHKKDKDYMCTVCGKAFSWQTNLNRHMNIHSGERPYECPICHKSYNQQGTLHNHIKIHTGKNHLCTICGKTFIQACDLNKHIQTHNDSRPYVCQICGKAFNIPQYLARHTRTHSETGVHTCAVCGLNFKNIRRLGEHGKTHRNDVDGIRTEEPIVRQNADGDCGIYN